MCIRLQAANGCQVRWQERKINMLIMKKKQCETCGKELTRRQRAYCSKACKLRTWYAEHKEHHAAASLRSYHLAKAKRSTSAEIGQI